VTRFDLVFAFFLTEILAHVEARLTDAQLAIGIASPQSVLSIITLDMDFANVGALGTKSREQFEFFLTSDLAEASGLKRTKFEVKLVEPGSVVVHAEVRGDVAKGKTSQLVAEDLRMQANNPKSLLRAGQITRKIKSFVIKAGSSTPPATVVHGQQEHKEQLEVRKEQLGTWVENLKQALIVAARARVEAEAEVEAMTTKCGEAETETFALQEKVGSMTTQLEAQDPIEKINQLDLQLEREKEISEKMQEKLKNIKEFESEQMKRAQREVEELKASLLEARQEFQKSEEEAGRLKDRVSRLEALDREQVTVAEELLKSKAKLLQQKKDVESLELRRKEEVAILESQITRLDEVLAAGARRCADQEKEVSRLEARVHEQDIALNDKRDRLHEQETALKNMQKEMSDLSESLTASSEARDMLQQKCHDIQGSCQRQLSELRQQLNRRCASFEADVRQLQQRECELRQQVVDDLPVTGEGKQADFQSQEYLHLESRLDALRCHLHEEEERHTREVLRSNLPFVFC
jgi:chromosome segregation ATPase